MNYPINLLDHHALVHTDDRGVYPIHTLLHKGPFLTSEPSLGLVHDSGDGAPSGYQLPDADAYARRMAEEAEAWLAHVRTRARMKEETVVRKALHALAFTLRHRAHDLAIPSKLTGTSKHQPTLWRLVRSQSEGVGLGAPLDIEEVTVDAKGKRPRLVVSYEGEALGEVQSKHVPWLRPLVPFGAGVFLTRVTGTESDYTLGCNVAFGRVGGAVSALNHALGANAGADGDGGDGASTEAAQAPPKTAPTEAQQLPERGGDGAQGDGAAGDLRLVSSGPSVAKPQADSIPSDDVVLYREIDGAARATVGTRPLEHVRRHSEALEWGYHGSGPADLALSVLRAFGDEVTAERLYVRFKEEIIARVPRAGGLIRAADIRAWITANTR